MSNDSKRIELIDVVRGFAVLGILKINIYGPALPQAAASNPTVAGGVTGLNLATLGFDVLFAEGRMRALFCMLFGAAFLIVSSRAKGDAAWAEFTDRWFRRNLWLTALGLFHAYVLLWFYDILFYYGLAGLFLYSLRNLSPRAVLWIAIAWMGLSAAGTTINFGHMREVTHNGKAAIALEANDVELGKAERDAREAYQDQVEALRPSPEAIAEETTRRRGGYLSNLAWTAKVVFMSHHIVPYGLESIEILVTMLIGMALFRVGILTGERPRAFYVKLALVSYGIAMPLQAIIFYFSAREGLEPTGPWSFLATGIAYQPLRYLIALGHLSALALLVEGRHLAWLTSRLGAAGRMALTNYMLQSVYCACVFYGFGLGLFGKLDRAALFGVCGIIWAFELLVSPLWLSYFRFGPVEWLWRSLTGWRREPFLLPPKAPAPALTTA